MIDHPKTKIIIISLDCSPKIFQAIIGPVVHIHAKNSMESTLAFASLDEPEKALMAAPNAKNGNAIVTTRWMGSTIPKIRDEKVCILK